MAILQGDFTRRLSRNKMAMAGLVVVTILFVVAFFANQLSPYPPDRINTSQILAPPSMAHFMGTDVLGRDVLSRIIHGAGVSLSVGFVAVGISTLIGVLLGAAAGYYGGTVERIIMRFVDIMLCFPTFFLILAVIAFIGSSIWNIMVVIGVTSWMGVTRLVRAEFLSIRERDFVQAAISQGAGDLRIIFNHILPNSMAPILVAATLGVACCRAHRIQPLVPGNRGSTTGSLVGKHAHRRERQHRDRVVAVGLPRACYPHNGNGLQFVGGGDP